MRFNGRTIYPYVDPRVLVDFVHKWGFSRRQFKDLRCFCDYAEWLSDSEDEPDEAPRRLFINGSSATRGGNLDDY